jgi:hypothetical protein
VQDPLVEFKALAPTGPDQAPFARNDLGFRRKPVGQSFGFAEAPPSPVNRAGELDLHPDLAIGH